MATSFPCSITINLPLPTPRLAHAALKALSVDKELSALVHREFSIISSSSLSSSPQTDNTNTNSKTKNTNSDTGTILQTIYSATTNRMLRVAVNGFMESLSVVLGVMEELDVDVLDVEDVGPPDVEGIEVGMK